MFQPETEDMLPRQAPKPSVPISATPAVQPAVPEVSILFGQQKPNYTATTTQPQEKPTYAAWKRQVLPRVTFPPVGSEVTAIMGGNGANNNTGHTGNSAGATITNVDYHNSLRSNLYPMRAASVATSPLVTTATMSTSVGFKSNNNIDTQEHAYRRSFENATTYTSPPPQAAGAMQRDVLGLNGGGFYPPLLQRRSLDNMQQSPQCQSPCSSLATAHDVLTICAGTQTDASLTPPTTTKTVETMSQSLRHLATKQDLEQVFLMLQQMREEQLHLTQICQVLLMEKQQQKAVFGKSFKDVGVQCSNSTAINDKPSRQSLPRQMPIMHDYIEKEVNNNENVQYPQTDNYCNQLQQEIAAQQQTQQYQSPRIPPIAQSTAYRVNTPRATTATALPPSQQQAQLPKPTTEKSMVMNELALKYLPNEKLDELLHDLNISPRTRAIQAPQQNTNMPLRNIENFDRNPNEISNASYKYLKKYRLLPEEHGGGSGGEAAAVAYQEQRQQQPQAVEYAMNLPQHSPYQRVASPLNGTPNSRGHAEILDLEHIRRQPKFL